MTHPTIVCEDGWMMWFSAAIFGAFIFYFFYRGYYLCDRSVGWAFTYVMCGFITIYLCFGHFDWLPIIREWLNGK